VGFFLSITTLIDWRFTITIISGNLTQRQRIDIMNVSSKFVIAINLISASTLFYLLAIKFSWF